MVGPIVLKILYCSAMQFLHGITKIIENFLQQFSLRSERLNYNDINPAVIYWLIDNWISKKTKFPWKKKKQKTKQQKTNAWLNAFFTHAAEESE